MNAEKKAKKIPPAKWHDFSEYADLIEWGIEFCTAAQMELEVENIMKEISKLEKKMADAELKITRNDAVTNDIFDQDMPAYYND